MRYARVRRGRATGHGDSADRAGRADRGDRGDIVISWLTKLVVVTALIGVVGFDGISIGVAKFNVADDATTAVEAASSSWQTSRHNIQYAYESAQEALSNPLTEEIPVNSFSIDPDGTVHLTVVKTARTLLLFRVHKLAHYAVVRSTASGKSIG